MWNLKKPQQLKKQDTMGVGGARDWLWMKLGDINESSNFSVQLKDEFCRSNVQSDDSS